MDVNPLDLTDQWALLKYAVLTETPRMKATTLSVLIRLLDHQNPKTGQCNPSISKLGADLRMSRRSVQYSIKELCLRGYIWKITTRNSSNSYVFKRPVQIDCQVQEPASSSAMDCTLIAQRPAPKKEKEKEKEKETRGFRVTADLHSSATHRNKQQDAEKTIVAALQRFGHTYEDLLLLPIETVTEICDRVTSNTLRPELAASLIVREIRQNFTSTEASGSVAGPSSGPYAQG